MEGLDRLRRSTKARCDRCTDQVGHGCLHSCRTGRGIQGHDAGVSLVLPPSSGGTAGKLNLVGVCECGWACRGAPRRDHACHYLDLKKEDSLLLVEEKSRAEQASYHRMHTDMGVCAWQAQTKGGRSIYLLYVNT